MSKIVHLIVIGAMKAGTSSLFELLATHPNIMPAIKKEPEYFSQNQSHKLKNVRRYRDLWPEKPEGPLTYLLEASTGYTKFPREQGVPQRIYEEGIDPKFIYIVRDPCKRIESQINWAVKARWFYPEARITDPRYVDPSRYAMQLDQFMQYFDLSQVLILDFDDLRDTPEKLCEAVAEFLAVENNFDSSAMDVVRNETRPETIAERFVLRTPILHKTFWRLPYRAREALRMHIFERSKPAEKITLTDAEREEIRETLALDMARLHEKYSFDTRKWGFL